MMIESVESVVRKGKETDTAKEKRRQSENNTL
jgi:hypothetical protein